MSSSVLNSKELNSNLPTDQSSDQVTQPGADEASAAPSLEANEAKTTEIPEVATQTAFNPGWRFYFAFSSMSAIILMVALDSTSLGNALPVRPNIANLSTFANSTSENGPAPPRHRNPGLLGRHIIPSRLDRPPAHRRVIQPHLRPQTTDPNLHRVLRGGDYYR